MTDTVAMGTPPPVLCRLCREHDADSPEHFIPKAAGNRGEVAITSLADDGRYVTKPTTDGYYEHVLCSNCNGDCSPYAQQYVEVIR